MNQIFTVTSLMNIAAFGLIIIGLLAIFTQRNIFKLIIGLNLADVGVNIFLVNAGYIDGGTAPIFTDGIRSAQIMTDPVPQALVLTAIVIGFGITALALGLTIRLFEKYHTLDVKEMRGLKW
ncbi:MAG: sodium:proton antiporter [Spirochaetales bacterium]|nr:sodium:proton antiporter [Spirochaetales bacterium]MCF7939448.1 sodium:proton antiporter [Spirochaetales bacterium]